MVLRQKDTTQKKQYNLISKKCCKNNWYGNCIIDAKTLKQKDKYFTKTNNCL